MRFWFDTEFVDDGCTIELISIGIVAEDGREYYAEPREFDRSAMPQWHIENVAPHLPGPVKPRAQIATEIEKFVGCSPEFWAYYAAYDWVALCQLYGPMIERPPTWPGRARDLAELAAGRQLPPRRGTEHNALADAVWCCDAWRVLSAAK